jgi:hypothetical protein
MDSLSVSVELKEKEEENHWILFQHLFYFIFHAQETTPAIDLSERGHVSGERNAKKYLHDSIKVLCGNFMNGSSFTFNPSVVMGKVDSYNKREINYKRIEYLHIV